MAHAHPIPKKRVNAKNGTGRVIYFDLVMIAKASLGYQDDREEVFNPGNNYGVKPVEPIEIKRKKQTGIMNQGRRWGEG